MLILCSFVVFSKNAPKQNDNKKKISWVYQTKQKEKNVERMLGKENKSENTRGRKRKEKEGNHFN